VIVALLWACNLTPYSASIIFLDFTAPVGSCLTSYWISKIGRHVNALSRRFSRREAAPSHQFAQQNCLSDLNIKQFLLGLFGSLKTRKWMFHLTLNPIRSSGCWNLVRKSHVSISLSLTHAARFQVFYLFSSLCLLPLAYLTVSQCFVTLWGLASYHRVDLVSSSSLCNRATVSNHLMPPNRLRDKQAWWGLVTYSPCLVSPYRSATDVRAHGYLWYEEWSN